jgi:hypothetical protein
LSVAEASVRSAEPDDEAGRYAVAVPGNALKKWEKAREFALGVPGVAGPRGGAAYRYSPWGETVAKVNKTLTCAQQGAPRAELACDWVEENCRTIAPKRLIVELDGR